MVVVGGHAVAAVPVEVEAHAIEGHAGLPDHVVGRMSDRVGRSHRPRSQGEVGGQARNVDLAVVHPAPFGLPRHRLAQLGEPGLGRGTAHEPGRIRDPPGGVVDEDAFGILEEGELRQSAPRVSRVPRVGDAQHRPQVTGFRRHR